MTGPRLPKLPEWKEDCGCLVNTYRYVKMCAKHEKENRAIHERWNEDKKRLEKERETAIKV